LAKATFNGGFCLEVKSDEISTQEQLAIVAVLTQRPKIEFPRQPDAF
jgi:hypothetical protein